MLHNLVDKMLSGLTYQRTSVETESGKKTKQYYNSAIHNTDNKQVLNNT